MDGYERIDIYVPPSSPISIPLDSHLEYNIINFRGSNLNPCATPFEMPNRMKGRRSKCSSIISQSNVQSVHDVSCGGIPNVLNPLAVPFKSRNQYLSCPILKRKKITTKSCTPDLSLQQSEVACNLGAWSTKSISRETTPTPFNGNPSTPNLSNVTNITDTDLDSNLTLSSTTSEPIDVRTPGGNFNCAKNAVSTLDEIRKKYVNNVVLGHLNINSLGNKFDALTLIIKDRVDIMVLVETKLDESYPDQQFVIEGYKTPFRLDRNSFGGGVLIYVRKDIPCKELNRHNFTEKVEALFVEINLRRNKFLLVGTYHSTHPKYGTSDDKFFEQIGFSLDVYSNYDKFLLAGDFNVQIGRPCIDDFLASHEANNLVKDFTCFKNPNNPSCIDLFLTNSYRSFMKTITISTGLSDFHNMIVTVLRTKFPKREPKVLLYRDLSKFIIINFRNELREELQKIKGNCYHEFEKVYLKVLDKHGPIKKSLLERTRNLI